MDICQLLNIKNWFIHGKSETAQKTSTCSGGALASASTLSSKNIRSDDMLSYLTTAKLVPLSSGTSTLSSPYLIAMSGDTRIANNNTDPNGQTKEYIKQQYNEMLLAYKLDNNGRSYIKDPRDQITSEGMTYWLYLTARMAQLDPVNASQYKQVFDSLLAGVESMIDLARSENNSGAFPAWKVQLSNGTLALVSDQNGKTANSAADADLDLIRSLIAARNLVASGVWSDNNYGAKARALIESASYGEKALLQDDPWLFNHPGRI
ncbi:MAG TPA: hypothetical protein DCS13_09030 [Candidatus Margulisbacteria bacterium]|nr:MAG: hypothetical protein A2X43_05240 [Candidatus Margulisbacteria bacterium GWD2_39_127]HAR63592.1 hypothetical protein [Candidatus Margulisiibacteriota bacterium]